MLTERKALIICRDLWKWLEKTGSADKAAWRGWRTHGMMIHSCPCCEYAYQVMERQGATGARCLFCPMLPVWDGYVGTVDDDVPCEGGTHPYYYQWASAKTAKARREAAGKIRRGAERMLLKLSKGRRKKRAKN
jgi:hypothetical protein